MNFLQLFIICCFICRSFGANILAILAVPYYSHHIIHHQILQELASRGHNLTIFTPYVMNYGNSSVTQHYLDGLVDTFHKYTNILDYKLKEMSNNEIYGFWEMRSAYKILKKVFENQEFQKLFKNREGSHYDLIMTECLLCSPIVLAEIYDCSIVVLNAGESHVHQHQLLGNFAHAAIHPDIYVQPMLHGELSFINRLNSFIIYRIFARLWMFLTNSLSDYLLYTTLPHLSYKSQDEIISKRLKLFLSFTSTMTASIRPTVPIYHQVGFMHVKKPQEVKDHALKEFLDESKDGVIILSFGSVAGDLSEELLMRFYEVFVDLPYNVIWKTNVTKFWELNESRGESGPFGTKKTKVEDIKSEFSKETGNEVGMRSVKACKNVQDNMEPDDSQLDPQNCDLISMQSTRSGLRPITHNLGCRNDLRSLISSMVMSIRCQGSTSISLPTEHSYLFHEQSSEAIHESESTNLLPDDSTQQNSNPNCLKYQNPSLNSLNQLNAAPNCSKQALSFSKPFKFIKSSYQECKRSSRETVGPTAFSSDPKDLSSTSQASKHSHTGPTATKHSTIPQKTNNKPQNPPKPQKIFKTKNILVSNWLPLADILAHPNVKLLISHSGLRTIEEAIDREVPMILIPLSYDQPFNAILQSKHDVAKHVDINKFTKESLTRDIMEMTKPKYKENVRKLRTIVYDKMTTGMTEAVDNIEDLLNHNETYEFLNYNAANNTEFTKSFYDVYLILFLTIYLSVKIIKTLSKIVSKFFSN